MGHTSCPSLLAAFKCPAVCALPALAWVAVGAAAAGLLLGLALARRLNVQLKQEFDPQQAHLENARLRAKVSGGAGSAYMDGKVATAACLPVLRTVAP